MIRIVEKKSVRLALALGWTLIVLVLCWMPTAGMTRGMSEERFLKIPHLDKVLHATMFCFFGILWCLAVSGKTRWVFVLAGGLAIAVLTEYVQGLPIVGRDSDLWDGLADTFGVSLGTVLAMIWLPRVRRVAKAELVE